MRYTVDWQMIMMVLISLFHDKSFSCEIKTIVNFKNILYEGTNKDR